MFSIYAIPPTDPFARTGGDEEWSVHSSKLETNGKLQTKSCDLGDRQDEESEEIIEAGPTRIEAGPSTLEAGPSTIEAGPSTTQDTGCVTGWLLLPFQLAGGLLICSLSVCPSVSLSVGHTSVFRTFLCRLLRY